MAKLKTLDFFLSLSKNTPEQSPVEIIEKLEPVLEPHYIEPINEESNPAGDQSGSQAGLEDLESAATNPSPLTQTLELAKVLEASDTSLRLTLWDRLRRVSRVSRPIISITGDMANKSGCRRTTTLPIPPR